MVVDYNGGGGGAGGRVTASGTLAAGRMVLLVMVDIMQLIFGTIDLNSPGNNDKRTRSCNGEDSLNTDVGLQHAGGGYGGPNAPDTGWKW